MALYTCKNCGAIEDLETGKLTYKGDNPLLKKVEDLQKEVFILKDKNTRLNNLLSTNNKKRSKAHAEKKEPAAGQPEPETGGARTFF